MKLWDKTPGLCLTEPEIVPYVPARKRSDAAIVIFPGGAYRGLADHEGRGYAEFLAEHGITAFVVNYRVAPHKFPLELLDARRAVRWVRAHGSEYGVCKDRVAVMGSSAGGHLTALVSTYREQADQAKVDPSLIADEKTPAAFIWHTAGDAGVNVINSYRYAEKLRNLNVPVEMHIFPYGHHGLGLAPQEPHVAQWSGLLLNWLRLMGWLA